MFRKMLHRFEITLLVLLLCLGVAVSSIGVTWCRYQVSHEENINFIVKGEGAYYVVPEQTAPVNEEIEKDYTISFSVFNTVNDEVPTTSHRFHVRWNSTTKQQASLFVKELSGREKEYEGVLIKETEGLYTYAFIDEDRKEALLIHPANEISEKQCRLVVKDPKQSFGSEIIILDDAYESEHQNTFTTHEVEDFYVVSNYFTKDSNEIILVDSEAVLTLKSNRDVSTRVYIVNEHENLLASINNEQELDVNLAAGVETKITFKLEKDEPVIEEPEQGEIVPVEPEETQDPQTPEQEESENPEEPVVTEEPEQEESIELLTLENPEETPDSTTTPEPTEEPVVPEVTVDPETPVVPEVTPTLQPTESPEPAETPSTTPEPTETPDPTPEPDVEETPEVPEVIEPVQQNVTVVWEILDENGFKMDEYHAVFTLKTENIYSEEVSVSMTSETESFNELNPIQISLSVDKDTTVSLIEGDGFPEKTRYSLDNGSSWTMLTKKGSIDLKLTEGNTSLLIDLSNTNVVFEEKDYSIIAYVSENAACQLDLKMMKMNIELLKVNDFQPGIITEHPISFTLNTAQVSIYMEKLVGNDYVWTDKEAFFNWTTEDNLTYTVSVKEDTEIVNGNYRIVIAQIVNDKVIGYEEMSLYAMGR